MSQVIYHDSFANSAGDDHLYTYTSGIETSTLSHDPVQNVEFAPFMGGPGHGLWPNEQAPAAGPYSAVNHPNYPPQPSYTSMTGHDSPPHAITHLADHHGNLTSHDNYPVPIAPGALQLEYYAPVAPEVPGDDPPGHAPIPDDPAGPPQDNSSPIHSGISDDEELKRLAKRYLNNRRAHVDKLLVRRRFGGGRRVLIVLEIDDAM